jgi:hypothetical protein
VTIGNRQSAKERVVTYAERFRHYLGRPPAEVIVSAEDFDVLDPRWFDALPYRIVRGPSVQEYRWARPS